MQKLQFKSMSKAVQSPVRQDMLKSAKIIDKIAIPMTEREIGDLAILFACWHLLQPSDHRITDGLLVTLARTERQDTLDTIDKLVNLFAINRYFKHVEIIDLNIPERDDIYIKHDSYWSGEIPRLGLKSGPNIQFFETIKLCSSDRYVLLNETDLFPLCPDWLDKVAQTVRTDHDWVVGSSYSGSTFIGPDIAEHINGAAVYASGNKEFQDFCKNIWIPGLENMCKQLPDTAYDIWLERFKAQALSKELWDESSQSYFKEVIRASGRFTTTHRISNLSLPTDFKPLGDLISSHCVLVHGKHFQSEILRYLLSDSDEDKNKLTIVQAFSIIARNSKRREITQALLEHMGSSKALAVQYKIISPQDAQDNHIDANHMLQANTTISSNDIPKAVHDPENSSVFAFSPFKSGSTLLFNALELLSAPIFFQRDYISLYDISFNRFGNTTEWLKHDELRSLLKKKRTIFGGFRDANCFSNRLQSEINYDLLQDLLDNSAPAVFIFLYRDPRDALTSLYFSHLKSHIVPKESEYLVKARSVAAESTIEDYIDQNKHDFLNTIAKMRLLAERAKFHGFLVHEFAYEAILTNQYKMFFDIASSLNISLNHEKWQELLSRSRDPKNGCSTPIDYIPSTENASSHIRKAWPGDHRNKLSEHKITELTLFFRDYLDHLAAINPSYAYS